MEFGVSVSAYIKKFAIDERRLIFRKAKGSWEAHPG